VGFGANQDFAFFGQGRTQFTDQALFVNAAEGFGFHQVPAQNHGRFGAVDMLSAGTAAASGFKGDFAQKFGLHAPILEALEHFVQLFLHLRFEILGFIFKVSRELRFLLVGELVVPTVFSFTLALAN
jgi:hypothetical protein